MRFSCAQPKGVSYVKITREMPRPNKLCASAPWREKPNSGFT